MIRAFTAFRGSIVGSVGALLSLKGAIVGAGIGFFAKSILDAAGVVETAKARLVGLKGSVDAAAESMDFFRQVAAKVPFTLEAVIEAGVALEAFGADSEETLVAVADLAGLMGTGIPEAASAFGRAFAGGRGAADILRDRGILPLIDAFAKINKISTDTLPGFRKALLAAMRDPAGIIAGSAERMAKTWAGQLSIMEDAIFSLKLVIADAGLLEFAKDVVALITKEVKGLTLAMEETEKQMEKMGEATKEAEEEGAGFLATVKVLAREGIRPLGLAVDAVGAGLLVIPGLFEQVGIEIRRTGETSTLLEIAFVGLTERGRQFNAQQTANIAGLKTANALTGDFTLANRELAKELERAKNKLKEQSEALDVHARIIDRTGKRTQSFREDTKELAAEFFNAGRSAEEFAGAAEFAAIKAQKAFLDAIETFKQLPVEMRQTVSEAVLAIDPEKIARRVEIFVKEIRRIQSESAKAVENELNNVDRFFDAFLTRLENASAAIEDSTRDNLRLFEALSAGFQATSLSAAVAFTAKLQALLDETEGTARQAEGRAIAASQATAFAATASLAIIGDALRKFGTENLAIQKAIGVAEAIVNTAVAITGALRTPGPAGIILAATIAAIGAAQIATILAARPGSRSTPSIGGGGGGQAGAPAAPPPAVMARPPSIVNISLQGFVGDEATLAAELHRLLREAEGDGVQVTVL